MSDLDHTTPPPSPRVAGSVTSTHSDLLAQLPAATTLLTSFGTPGFILQLFPQLLTKLARYPRLSKLLSVALTLILTSYLGATKATEVLSAGWSSFVSLFTSSVTLDGNDPVVLSVQTWLRRKKLWGVGSNFVGESSYQVLKRTQEECEDEDYDDIGCPVDKVEGNGEKEEEKPFKMVLHSKRTIHLFRHRGRVFLIRKERTEGTYDPGAVTNLTFYCFGWSQKPILELVHEIDRSQKVVKQQERWTTIRSSNEEHSYGNWSRPANRLARPLSTVDLDEGQRDMVVQDVAEYLSAATKEWYNQQGIPYRRGYLFYGPPGTGKSSLAMALAGHFKLDIHIISLLDKNMNDYTLNRLMKSMTGRPLVLLEDVDSAGISRDFNEDSDDDDSDDEYTSRRRRHRTSRVTLSGLLNAIDGVSAPEGQVLIMTTNHIEALDDALIRAGRVDVRVKLAWCSRSQTRDIFLRMYRLKLGGPRVGRKCECDVDSTSSEGLQVLAERFSNQIPEYQVSPAELQDFILMRKGSPERAVAEVKGWVDKLLDERREAAEDEEKRRKKKEQRRRAKKRKQADESDDEGSASEENTENGEGKQTPPPSFEDVEKEKKEGLIRWLVKQIVNGPDPIAVPAPVEVQEV